MEKFFDLLKGDRVIWFIVALLSGIGLIEVFSSTSMLAYRYQDGQTSHYFIRHLFFILLGLAVMFTLCRVSYKHLYKLAGVFLVFCVFLLVLTYIKGVATNSAKRWLDIGGLSFQTSDVAKLSLMIYLAKVLSQARQEGVKMWDVYKKCLLAVGVVCGLILPSNFSTAFLVGLASLFVMFVGNIRPKWLLATVGVAVVCFGLFVAFVELTGAEGTRVGTWTKRIETFFGSETSKDAQFQSQQAKIAIALGDIIGKGPGNSNQRNILPHPYSDFIFAIIVEEGGLIVGLFVVVLYSVFFARCIKITRNSEKAFPAFMVLGLSLNIMFQAVVNMLVAVSIIPVTGQTLPFVSMGGTSILFNSVAVGIILNVSRYAAKKETVEDIEENQEVEEVVDYPFIAG